MCLSKTNRDTGVRFQFQSLMTISSLMFPETRSKKRFFFKDSREQEQDCTLS